MRAFFLNFFFVNSSCLFAFYPICFNYVAFVFVVKRVESKGVFPEARRYLPKSPLSKNNFIVV